MRLFSFLIITVILSLIVIQAVSAEIVLNQPATVYNLQDSLNVKASVSEIKDSNGFFELNLVCNNQVRNFYRVPMMLKAGEQRSIETSLFLTSDLNSFGNCTLSSSYSTDSALSSSFRISNKLDLFITSNNLEVEAGKNISIQGIANRENGKKVEGIVEVYLENSNLKFSSTIQNGSFFSSFVFPENQKSGNYSLQVKVYEVYDGQITNQGLGVVYAYVKQTPKKIDILFENDSVVPGNNFAFFASIYDQADDLVQGVIDIEIKDAKSRIFLQGNSSSNSYSEFYIERNSTPGYWKVTARAFNLSSDRLFYVSEYEKASFNVINSSLIITNIGNVIYKKPVLVTIGNHSQTKNLNLDIGESIRFKLNAPDGEYDIKVTDGQDELRTRSFLTGSVVGVNQVNEGLGFIFKYPLVWIFIILVCGFFVFNLIRKTSKRASYSYPAEETRKSEPGVIKLSAMPSTGRFSVSVSEAEHHTVLEGNKENACLIAVKIENFEEARKIGVIEKIKEIVINYNGALYHSNGFLVAIFSSQLTKTINNELVAVKVADAVEKMINEHNSKFKITVEYGIGVNNGKVIARKDDKLRFASIGNTLALAKRIADLSDAQALLSESVNLRVMNDVKTERKKLNGMNVYAIRSIIDREKHLGFISSFLQRQRK